MKIASRTLNRHADKTETEEPIKMSCWVVPSIAAEIWGVSLQDITDRMKAGSIPSKSESGFTFVDVAPDSPKVESPKARITPPTYTIVTHEEVVALVGEDEVEEETVAMGDWRIAREDVQKLRRPPIAA
jgi:hypothetical protein